MYRLNQDEISEFLGGGAFLSWDEDSWLVSWGDMGEGSSTQANWVIPEFYSKAESLSYKNSQLVSKQSLLRDLAQMEQAKQQRQWQPPQKEAFSAQLELIFQEFESSRLAKAVPVVFENSEQLPSEQEKLQILIKLLRDQTSQFAYGHWDQGQGVIGLSPELLFEAQGQGLKTMALAGTRSKQSNSSLLEDSKEMSEHKFVVDELSRKLSLWGEVFVGKTEEAELPQIVHLKTSIELKSKDKLKSLDICNELHPTPALGISANDKSIDHHWLKNLEQHSGERKFFGAPFGASFQGKTRVVVGIRNIQWFEGNTYLGSGCGIVKESVEDKEWAELKLKRDVVREALGL